MGQVRVDVSLSLHSLTEEVSIRNTPRVVDYVIDNFGRDGRMVIGAGPNERGKPVRSTLINLPVEAARELLTAVPGARVEGWRRI